MVGFAGTGTREIEIQQSIGVLAAGGPPLTGSPLAPIGLTDDQGIYLFVPALAHALGIADSHVAIAAFALSLLAATVILYPLVLMRLLDSYLAAAAVPLVVALRFAFVAHGDIYWVNAWCVLLLLPIVLLLHRRWPRWGPAALASIVVIASFATSLRNHAGLPVLLAAVMIVLAHERSWMRRLGVVLLLLVAYVSVSGGVLTAARVYRDLTLGVAWSQSAPVSHPFWHPVYLGLGFLPNPYGIRWDDSVALQAVRRDDPQAAYLSPQYEGSLRRQYFEIVRRDPAFVASTYVAKAEILIFDVLERFGATLLLIPLALVVARPLRRRWRYVVLPAPFVAINAVPPLLGVPAFPFEIGWLAAWGVTVLLAFGWLCARLEGVARTAVARHESIQGAAVRAVAVVWRTKIWIPVVAISAAAIFVLQLLLQDASDRRTYTEASSPFIRPASVTGQQIRSWQFDGSLPESWTTVGPVAIDRRADGIEVRTTPAKFAYELQSSDELLAPGHYELVVAGRIRSGGATLGILDMGRNAWIRSANYWSGIDSTEGDLMGFDFTTSYPVTVRIVLSNWNLRSQSSSWLLRGVQLMAVRGE